MRLAKNFQDNKISFFLNEKRTIKKLLKLKEPIILDIGANIGQTCKMIKKIFPEATIHSVEPVSTSFDKLLRNTKKYNKIKHYNFGLGEKNQVKPIYINNNNNRGGSSMHKFNLKSIAKEKNYHPKEKLNNVENNFELVQIKNSNKFLNDFNLIDYCKIDTQGSEYYILKSLTAKNLNKIKVLKLELMLDDVYSYDSQKNYVKILNLLIKNNFKIYDISNIYKNINDSRTLWLDCFFVNKSHYKI